MSSELDNLARIADPTTTETPTPWVGTTEIENNAVTTAKIQDGSITSSKLEYTVLWTGDSQGQDITLSDDPLNYKYLIFEFKSTANANAYGTCKIPTNANTRYTVSTMYMHQNGGIGMDCIQFAPPTTSAPNTLAVRYQGQNAINSGGSIATYTTTQIHILRVLGTDIEI